MNTTESGRQRCKDKVVALIGCGTGQGGAIARRIISEGGILYIFDIDDAHVAEVKEELNELGPGRVVGTYHVDVSDPKTLEPAFQAMFEDAGRIDMLVTVALYCPSTGRVYDTPYEDAMKCIVGSYGYAQEATRLVVPVMARSGGGSITHVSSMSAVDPEYNQAAYASGKAALNALVENTAYQCGHMNIRCNAVMPGFVPKPEWNLPQEFIEGFTRHIPLGRYCYADDIAKALMFFMTDDSAHITGQCLPVDGGYGIGSKRYYEQLGSIKDQLQFGE